MNTTFRIMLTLFLAAGLFAFPSTALADDPPPTGFQMVEGMPVGTEDYEQAADGVPLAASPATYYKTLTGLDFHPTRSDLSYTSTDGGLYALTLVDGWGFVASFTLPNTATVTGITFFVVDNDPDSNISLDAQRHYPAINAPSFLSLTSTSGVSPDIQSISLTGGLPFTISNFSYAYRLNVEFGTTGSTQMLYGARIAYTIPSEPPSGYQYVTMAGADFRSNSSNMTYTAIGGTLYATAIDPSYYFITRLDLPEGAVIDEVKWFLIDNHTEYFNLNLYSHTVSSDTLISETSSSTSGDTPSDAVRTITENDSLTIDNRNKSYFISFMPKAASSDLRIVGARVRYTLSPSIDPRTNPIKTISGIHFYPSGSSLTYKALGAKLFALALSSGRSFQVSLNLPTNIHINRIIFYFKDDSAENISFTGRYYFPSTGNYQDPVTGSSSAESTSIRAVALSGIGMGVFDTHTMVARLRVVLGVEGQDMYLVGAKVEYIYPQVYLPLIIRE